MGRTGLFLTKSLVGLLAFGLILTGCGTKGVSNLSSSSGDRSQQEKQNPGAVSEARALDIEHRVHTETLRDEDGTVLLDLKITYPEIKNPVNSPGISKINEYYGIQFDDFISNTLAEGLEMARGDKESAQSGGFEFRPHRYERRFEIYYNGNNLLSIVNLQYENTNGAHPNSSWLSESFNVKSGKKLALSDILGLSREEALEKVYETVLAQIKETEGTDAFIYQENYQENLRKGYSEDDFVLTSSGLMFYYQPYAIAAYAAGIPKFELPYTQMKAPALNIPVLPQDRVELDLYIYNQAGNLIDRNKEAYFEIFGLSMLKMNVPEKRGENDVLFPVTDKRFASFADFEQFVRSTFTQSEADLLLSNGRYRNVDGKLYGDISKDAGMGYYVNWDDYRYVIEDITNTSASLNIFTTEDSPAGKNDVTLTIKMKNENGTWLLERMAY